MLKKILFLCLLLPFLTFGIVAEAPRFPAKPANYVTDIGNYINDSDEAKLNDKLKSFESSTSNQIFVYITNALNGEDLELLSQEIFHEWHIGQQNKNNGVLIAIFVDDHKFRIQTGYGLEGQLPDLLTKRIQDEDMRPQFKSGNYYGGIDAGVDKLIYYTKHTFVPDENDVKPKHKNIFLTHPGLFALIPLYFFNLIAFLMVFFHLLGKRGKRLTKKNRKILWIASLLLFPIPFIGAIITIILGAKKELLPPPSNSGYSGTTYSSSSSGYDSSYSSSSSSDFGGGGGGDSGGGGSSSDW